MALGLGVGLGIGSLAALMNYLLTQHMSLTFATFSGLIAASSLLVARRVTVWRMQEVGLLLLGIIVALKIVTLPHLQSPPDTLWYLFLCGMIGITAMILPGISGAFILLLLGRYHQITAYIKGIVHGDISLDVLLALSVFALGCLTGLLGFSRILKLLLARFHDATMVVLCGFMIGSLYKLWPFQIDLNPEAKFKHKQFAHFMPDLNSDVWICGGLFVVGLLVVLSIDWFSRSSDTLAPTPKSA